MARKYLPTGAINPAWAEEEEVRYKTDEIMSFVKDIYENVPGVYNFELYDGINLCVDRRDNHYEYDNKAYSEDELVNMCNIKANNLESEYEAKLNFLKNHMDNPEDFKLALKIIGIK